MRWNWEEYRRTTLSCSRRSRSVRSQAASPGEALREAHETPLERAAQQAEPIDETHPCKLSEHQGGVKMIALLIVLGFAIRLIYLCWFLGQRRLALGHPAPPKGYMPLLSLVGWGFLLLATSYWGIAGNPYRVRPSSLWPDNSDESTPLLILALGVAIALSYVAAARLWCVAGTRTTEYGIHRAQPERRSIFLGAILTLNQESPSAGAFTAGRCRQLS